MKASEIQIGDFILIKREPYKVESITKRKVGYHLKEKECHMHYIRTIEVDPIELSEDFIEDTLEFSRNQINGSPSWEYSIDNEYHITINIYSNTKGRNYSVHIDNGDFETTGSCDVQYLHQLQQMVRLATDKEMEIKL